MASGLRRTTVALAMLLLSATAALGAPAADPPPGAFTGTYEVSYRVTNVKKGNTFRYIFSPRSPCSSPCRSVSLRQRPVSAKSWGAVLTYRWNGSAYAIAATKKVNAADCVGRSGADATKGYDITSTQSFRITVTTNGRVVRFRGTGRDVYVPNAVGRKAGCARGTYLYSLNGVTR